MSRYIKKPKEKTVATSFRIPKIDDPKEREFFMYSIRELINELSWIRHSLVSIEYKEDIWITKKDYRKFCERNIKNSFKNMQYTFRNFYNTYKDKINIQESLSKILKSTTKRAELSKIVLQKKKND